VSSHTTYEFKHLSLYNFKVSEDTISELTNSCLQLSSDSLNVKGSVSMNKLLLAKQFDLSYMVQLEQTLNV